MELILWLVPPAIVGVAGFLAGRYVRMPKAVEDALEAVVPLSGHEHDWHVRGKRQGKVVRYCTLCDREEVR